MSHLLIDGVIYFSYTFNYITYGLMIAQKLLKISRRQFKNEVQH